MIYPIGIFVLNVYEKKVLVMLMLILCMGFLVIGYFTYAKVVDRIFETDPNKLTPALSAPDGVDTVPLPTWRVFLIQLLDIAGIGPIFGPILGALYGPVALIWIVIGTIFAGGVHDYFSGMLSIRYGGASLPEVVRTVMGKGIGALLFAFSFLLLLLVGVVFVTSPATLLSSLLGLNTTTLVILIFIYYFLATILPIDSIIAKLYPLFGALMLFMTAGVFWGLLTSENVKIPWGFFEMNHHPGNAPIWPLLFITISCGAISGFHSTQSPIMARCLVSEKYGRHVFYGAMVAEGFIALIWATVGICFYRSPDQLYSTIQAGTPALVVSQACLGLMGPILGSIAIIGVIVLPITSGDTAFRSNRLILAGVIKLDQNKVIWRLVIAIPLFLMAFVLSKIDFSLVWRYFGWSNQALAALMLWSAAIYLVRLRKSHWVASLPASFMTAVVISFILQADIGFGLKDTVANWMGVVLALFTLLLIDRLSRRQHRFAE